MTINDFLSNAAVASQRIELLDEGVTRGAVLRSLVQWLESCKGLSVGMMVSEVKDHEDYNE